MSLSGLFNKIKSVFGDLATDKRVASRHRLSMFPRYVIENLASQFIEMYGEERYAKELTEFIARYYHEAREKTN